MSAPEDTNQAQAPGNTSAVAFESPSGDPGVTGSWAKLWRMTKLETKLLARRKLTVMSSVFAPLVLLGYALLLKPDTPVTWAVLAGLASVVNLLISTYHTAANVLTLRRESLVLSRLRTTELAGWQILAAALAPLLAVGLLQAMVVYVLYVVLGAPLPHHPLLVLLGMLLAGLLVVTAGVATCTITTSAEGVQFAVMPLILAAAIGANIIAGEFPDAARAVVLLIPVTPLADLVARAWVGTTPQMLELPVALPPVLVDLLLLAGWALVFLLVAHSRWRWTPRG